MSGDAPKLKTVGMLTGLSYVSGIDYYRGVNEQTAALLPKGKHMKPNPPMVVVSLTCDEYVDLLSKRDDEGVISYLFKGIEILSTAKVDFVVICSNTAHIVYPTIQQRLPHLDVLHIADCTALACKAQGMTTVGLLGTAPTMRDGSWLISRLALHGLTVVVPAEAADRRRCYEDIIVQELSFEVFKDDSRDFLLELVEKLKHAGCQGVILGCTELELLVHPGCNDRAAVPLIRSAAEHITAASRVLAGEAALTDFLPAELSRAKKARHA